MLTTLFEAAATAPPTALDLDLDLDLGTALTAA